MPDSYVCSGAIMRCTMGTSPANLTVLPIRTVFLTGQPMANISDHKSMVNLAPFGLCRSLGFPPTASATAAAHGHLTPMPCVHNTPAPWMGGKMDYLIKGQPALLKSCKCQCMWGGTISLVTDGQVGEGTQWVQKKPKDNFQINCMIKQGREALQTDMDKLEYDRVASIISEKYNNLTEDERDRAVNMTKEMPKILNNLEKLAIAENNIIMEKTLGVENSGYMSDDDADKRKSNMNYGANQQFEINCATTATTFMVRQRGFEVTAKARNANSHTDSIAYGINLYDAWRNIDGSTVSPTMLLGEFNAKVQTYGLATELTALENIKAELLDIQDKLKNDPNLSEVDILILLNRANQLIPSYNQTREKFVPVYKEVLMEACKDEGYYTFRIAWEPIGISGAHYTVLKSEKDSEGNTVITNIEPQTGSPFTDIDTMLKSLDFPPYISDSIMRTDNKTFNPEYNDLFDTNP